MRSFVICGSAAGMIALAGLSCATSTTATKIVGPTLRLPEAASRLPGVDRDVPGWYSNRAWSLKPDLLAGLVNLMQAVGKDPQLEDSPKLMLVTVVSSILKCYY